MRNMTEESTRTLPNDNLALILERLDSIDSRLGRVETRLDRDTKPIRENALKEIADVRMEMQQGFEKIQSDLNAGVRRMERKIDVLNQNILEVRADPREVMERMDKIDPQPA